jgi:hypothetical protein
MLTHHYLPTLVDDRRIVREASAKRHRLLRSRRADRVDRPTLTLAAPAVRTAAEAATQRAA